MHAWPWGHYACKQEEWISTTSSLPVHRSNLTRKLTIDVGNTMTAETEITEWINTWTGLG